jgi:hypothetical protein
MPSAHIAHTSADSCKLNQLNHDSARTDCARLPFKLKALIFAKLSHFALTFEGLTSKCKRQTPIHTNARPARTPL